MERRTYIPTADGATLDAWISRDDDTPDDAPAVIVCHGFVQNRFSFETPRRSLLSFLRSLGLVVWAVELRGRDGAARAHGLHDYVDVDAPAVITAARARHPSVSWIGHSLGGIVGATLRDAALDAVVALGSPLLPGPRRWRGLGAKMIDAARLAHDRGLPFSGRRWSAFLWRARHVLDEPRTPAPVRLWAPGSLAHDELEAVLKRSFSDDSFAVFADLLELNVTNRARAGLVTVASRLAAQRVPLLVVAGEADDLAPPDAARPLYELAGSKDKHYVELSRRTARVAAGHIDLVVGEHARAHVWPQIAAFLRRHQRGL
jgi:polyhydroxyalkanoate synthase